MNSSPFYSFLLIMFLATATGLCFAFNRFVLAILMLLVVLSLCVELFFTLTSKRKTNP
jgi:cyanate permease